MPSDCCEEATEPIHRHDPAGKKIRVHREILRREENPVRHQKMTTPKNQRNTSNSLETDRLDLSVSSTGSENETLSRSYGQIDSPIGDPLLSGHHSDSKVRAVVRFSSREWSPIGGKLGRVLSEENSDTGNRQPSKALKLRVPCGFIVRFGKEPRHGASGRLGVDSLANFLFPGGQAKLILAQSWPERVKDLRLAYSANCPAVPETVGAFRQPRTDSAYAESSARRSQIEKALFEGLPARKA